ncbi:hypothetical protein BC829DRAFT_261603 [Chytridium lagenaria]|nr:hypothetical protein BC829DRAFT_261603 [Chytridium lagenaria]
MHMVGCMKADLEQAKASLESEIQSHATTASQRDESSRLCSELTQRIEKLEAEKLQLRADCERFEQTSTDALKTKENLDVEKTKLKADHDYLIQQCINLVASLDQVSAEKEKWKAACEVAERSLDVGKSEREEIEGRLTEMTRVNEELEAERKRFQGIAEEAEESKKLLSQDLRTKTKEGEIMKVVMDKMREMMERSLQDPNIIKKLVAFRKEGFSVDQIAIIAPVADKIADGDSAYTNPQQSLSLLHLDTQVC